MLIVKPIGEESQDEKQGKMLLLTEYSLLSLLHDQIGVIHHHGLFKVIFYLYLVIYNAINLIFNFLKTGFGL